MVVSSYTYAFTMVVDLAITREVRPGSTLAETAVELEAQAAARVETLAQALGLGGYSLTFRTLFPPMPPSSRPPSRPPSHPAQRASTGLQLVLPLSVGGASIAVLAMLALLARRYLGVELSVAAR